MSHLHVLPVERKTVYEHNDTFVWNGITGIEAADGVILYSWYTGGEREPRPENLVVFTRSMDGGETWASPEIACDPPGAVRAADPMLWIGPDGVLRHWLCVNDSAKDSGDWQVLERTSSDYCGPSVSWTEPTVIEAGLGDWLNMNKPIVLSDGSWMFPAMVRNGPSKGLSYFEGFKCAGVVITADAGLTWEGRTTPDFAGSWIWEPMVIQRDNGDILMYFRTDYGQIFQVHSADQGRTWSEFSATGIPNPNTRFHLRKLPTGQIILLNNPNAENWGKRTPLALHISRDDARTWPEMYIIDTGEIFMYPDACLDADGHTLHMSYENRKDIFYASFDLAQVL